MKNIMKIKIIIKVYNLYQKNHIILEKYMSQTIRIERI